jgi:hypothetical protein
MPWWAAALAVRTGLSWCRIAFSASLRCALLRLMMTGIVCASAGSLRFLVGFVVSELFELLSGFGKKGAVRLTQNAVVTVFKIQNGRIIKFVKGHLVPYRAILLTSL